MPDQLAGPDFDALAVECGRAAVRFFLGADDLFDLDRVLATCGLDASALRENAPDTTDGAVALARCAGPLRQATSALAALEVAGNDQRLSIAAASAELWRTSDPDRLRAIGRAVEAARLAALREPLAAAWDALKPPSSPVDVSAISALTSTQLRELVSATRCDRQRLHRLVRARMQTAPLPIDAWRQQLRPLIQALTAARGTSIGVASHDVGYAPAAFCGRHPQRTDRTTLFVRADASWSTARTVAVALGRGLGGADRALGLRLAGVLIGRLANAALWLAAGLGRGAARDAARGAGACAVRLLARAWAYCAAGDDDPAALAAAAAEILDERDDLASALCWRGPFPDTLGLPLPAGAPRYAVTLGQLERGLALDAALTDAIGDDWHAAPEAAEALLELAAAAAPPAPKITAACLALGDRQ